jgi:hypothetical protein
MSGTIGTGNHPLAFWPGIKAIWGRSYTEHPKEWLDLFDWEGSEKAYEQTFEATGFGLGNVKDQGAPTKFDSESQGTVNKAIHVAYSLGYKVTYEEMRDNLYEEISGRRATALAFSARQTREIVCANMYNRAFDPAHTFGDGTELIHNAHPTRSGTQSNVLAVASDLSETAIEDLTIQIMMAENSRGLQISLGAQGLLVHPSEFYEANRILNSTMQTTTATRGADGITNTNAINAIKSTNAITGSVRVNHYFTDPDAWFIRTNAPRGMVGYNREEISFDQDNEFSTKNACAMYYERYSVTSDDFRGIYGSPGA